MFLASRFVNRSIATAKTECPGKRRTKQEFRDFREAIGVLMSRVRMRMPEQRLHAGDGTLRGAKNIAMTPLSVVCPLAIYDHVILIKSWAVHRSNSAQLRDDERRNRLDFSSLHLAEQFAASAVHACCRESLAHIPLRRPTAHLVHPTQGSRSFHR